ncbi:PREDICTED: target of Nesh-SH3 isoform X4 [Chinchilla lanigera]|uniref:target of Nesh-SH3 isoform X4 n=1 Tax=Chinchilla lanigera TaxID=34839 RepID=UPI000695BAE8|nr:PREDICTED: target of Nesh-SH3 isoform X4 [Chinchilla lanigera]
MQRPPLPLEDSPLKCGSRAARHPPASLPVGGSKCNMPSSLGCLLLCGSIALALGNAQKLPKGKKPSLKVHINTTSDSILLKFLRPNPNVKLEGFLLGYGSNVSPNQYFPLPTEGKYAEAVVDAEPKYLIVVRPVPPPSQKKSCSGKTRARKPLQLVVGTLSPSSVFLSWGFLINPHHDWTLPSHCPNDRLYTIRYREKDKEKKWIFQLCPATETIVDNLKPNTVYEFGVKDNVEGGIWSKIFNHKTIVGSKNKVNGKIQSTYDQVHTVPAYIPRKLIPVTIIKQVIQNVTHRASTKSPDKTPFGGTILVHFIIPGLNDTSAKLPPSIMLEISDALKAQLAKNETLALPVESKTLEVDKITAQHITVTPETVPRTTKPTMSSTPDISQTALVLSQRTQETLQTILLPKFELPRSTPAPKGLLEFPEAKTSFPFEKFGVTSVTSEKSWMAPAAKTLGDSGVVKPHTATYDVPSSPSTSDEPGISEPPTATSDPTLDSVPPKTSRTLEQPRATLAPSEAPFIPQKVETFTSPAPKPTTHAPQQTTSIPSTPKRRLRPKTPRTKPAPGPQTLPPPQPTKAPPKTKRPGHRPRPKTTRSPGVPKSEPALEAATAHPEPMVPKLAPKPSKRPKTSHRPDVPHMKPDSKPPVQLRPKPQITAHPDTPPTKSVPTTDTEPVLPRTGAPVTTLAPKITQRTRTRRPRPKHKSTVSPKVHQTKPDFGPITPGPSLAPTKRTHRPHPKPKTTPRPETPQTVLVPTTIAEPVIVRTEAPGPTLAPKVPQHTPPHPKPKTTWRTGTLQTELVPTEGFEQVAPVKEAPKTAIDTDPEPPVTELEPVTFRAETSGTTLATKIPKRTRRPRPRPKTTWRPQAPQTKPVPATAIEPVTLHPEAAGTTLAPKPSQWTHQPHPRPKPIPSLEAPEPTPVPTAGLEPVTLRPETWVTTQAPKTSKRTRRPRPRPRPRPRLKPKATPSPKASQIVLSTFPATDLEPGTLRTGAPDAMVLTTVLEPVTLRTKAPETTLAPKILRTRRPRPRPKTTSSPEASQTQLVPVPGFQPDIHSTEAPETTLAPTEPQTLILTPVTSPSLEMAYSQPVSDILESVTFNTESSKETIAPAKTDYVYPTTKIPPRPEEPKTEGVVESVPPEITLALRQTPRTTPKTKTSQHPRIPQTQPVPKGPPRATSRPKTSPSPEVSHTTYGPEDVPFPHEQDPDVSQSEPVLQPVTFRIEPPKTTTAPSETRGIPLIPIISPSLSQEELLPTFEETDQTTQELFTTKIPQELFTTKIPQTTELAKTTQAPRRLYTIPVRPRIPDRPPVRPVLNRTTTKPIRPRPSGIPSRNGVGTGPKQGPKPSGPVRNVSVDSTQATKRPATIPGTRRPPLPPRPVPPRRKPLPPNNVTGKPGSSGIISSHRVTSPPLKATLKPTLTTSERPETDKKQPTAPASGEEFGNTTDFSSSPTRETDHLGKPRFKGPHVRYIPKPESKPCSITDSVQRFPTEEAMEGHATSPPQNPPTNLTVVTVEGCPSFVILDWEKPLNDTVTEYEVISRENGSFSGKNKSIQVTNQTFSTVENLKPDTSYEFQVKPKNPLGEGPASNTVAFSTESADPRVSEPVSAGRDAIWTERPFNSDSYSECKGKQYVKRTWYKKFVGVQLCNSLRYKIYLSDSLTGQFYNIGDQRGHGEDHCQFVDSFLDGRTGQHLSPDQLPTKEGYFRAVRQEPVQFGEIGGHTQINYVQWYECGTTIPGKW